MPNHDIYSLYCFQVYDLFGRACVEAFLRQPEWAISHPDLIEALHSSDIEISNRVLLPEEIVLAVARNCNCVGDLFEEVGGETLHIVTHGDKPFKFWVDSDNQISVEEIVDAAQLSPEQAIVNFGADAVWLAQEYGKSQRGERDDRYRKAYKQNKQ